MNSILMRVLWCLTMILISILPTVWANAAELPAPGERDQRVRYVTYKQDDVTTIHVSRGVITRIVPDAGEARCCFAAVFHSLIGTPNLVGFR